MAYALRGIYIKKQALGPRHHLHAARRQDDEKHSILKLDSDALHTCLTTEIVLVLSARTQSICHSREGMV